jgi:Zinc-finger of C2H2 type
MYQCEVCSKNFDSQHNLNGHLVSRTHARREQAQRTQHSRSPIHDATQFHCCDCDRDFVNEVALLQHLAIKHNAEAETRCDQKIYLRPLWKGIYYEELSETA